MYKNRIIINTIKSSVLHFSLSVIPSLPRNLLQSRPTQLAKQSAANLQPSQSPTLPLSPSPTLSISHSPHLPRDSSPKLAPPSQKNTEKSTKLHQIAPNRVLHNSKSSCNFKGNYKIIKSWQNLQDQSKSKALLEI